MNDYINMRKLRTVSQNPFIQTIYTADPSAHVWEDGRIYIYASRDMDPPKGCDCMDHYHVFSTEDLVNWRDEEDGTILTVIQSRNGHQPAGALPQPNESMSVS